MNSARNYEFVGSSQIVELRRYVIKPGARDHFAEYFESYFPEAFQQLGAMVLGQFRERGNEQAFTWLRRFEDADARARVNEAFYDGPLWREHAATMNDRLVSSDNVLLLRPLRAASDVPVLPAVDPVREPKGARGVVVARILAAEANNIEDVGAGREAGLREAGILVSDDGPNTFPRHPVRSDGRILVWLGIAKDDEMVEAFRSGLREQAELLVLEPTRRSSLRWLPESG